MLCRIILYTLMPCAPIYNSIFFYVQPCSGVFPFETIPTVSRKKNRVTISSLYIHEFQLLYYNATRAFIII